MNKIITSNMYLGADNQGIEQGIETLKQQGILMESTDCILAQFDPQQVCHKKNLKYYSVITEYLQQLYQTFLDTIGENDKPILVGGDHSIGIASVTHSLEKHENLGLVWIDAHADINTDELTNSGNIHGMSVASLLGLGERGLSEFIERTRYLDPEKIVYIGLRDVEAKEQQLLDELAIRYYTFSDVEQLGIQTIVNEAIIYLKNNDVEIVHISYDLDSADPQEVPGVSTPVPGGLTLDQTVYLLEQFCDQFDIAAMDIVEFNPTEDKENKTVEFFEVILCCAENWIKEYAMH